MQLRPAISMGTCFGLALLVFGSGLGCGRGGVLGLGGEGDGGGGNNPFADLAKGDTGRSDTGGFDGGSFDFGGFDAGPMEAGFFDAGSATCNIPRDCFRTLGRPPCNGDWDCIDGSCIALCPNPCLNDCDCEIGQRCINGECRRRSDLNLCCGNLMTCPPDGLCETPGGGTLFCGGGPDAGVPDLGNRDGGSIACMRDCDCDPFLACLGGACQPAGRINQCCTSPFCPPGQMCEDPQGGTSVCPSPPQTPVGSPCTDPMGCGPVGFCLDEGQGFPGGYCSEQCGPAGSLCPGDAVCVPTGNGDGLCMDGCTNSSQCRMSYACIQVALAPSKVCLPVRPGSSNPNGGPVGSECSADDNCGIGLECLTEGDGWPLGYCTKFFCDPVSNACPMASSCYAFPGIFSACLENCSSGGSQSNCRAGYYCLGPTGLPGVCIP